MKEGEMVIDGLNHFYDDYAKGNYEKVSIDRSKTLNPN